MDKPRRIACTTLGALILASCAPTVKLVAFPITQPPELKACQSPKLPPPLPRTATVGMIVGQTTQYSTQQATALADCSRKNAENTRLIEEHNRLVDQITSKPWWKAW